MSIQPHLSSPHNKYIGSRSALRFTLRGTNCNKRRSLPYNHSAGAGLCRTRHGRRMALLGVGLLAILVIGSLLRCLKNICKTYSCNMNVRYRMNYVLLQNVLVVATYI